MSKIIALIMSISMTMTSYIATDEFKAIAWAEQHYQDCEVELFTDYDPNVMENREGKNIVYIEVIESTSNGDGTGTMDGGWMIAYNTTVPQGEHVMSYCIYNPNTNYCDDVVAVVDNGMIRD